VRHRRLFLGIALGSATLCYGQRTNFNKKATFAISTETLHTPVDYKVSATGFPVPATVVHRHVDGQGLTENLYTYEPFGLFTTDTTIRYSDATDQK
jgi:hypothetical protein